MNEYQQIIEQKQKRRYELLLALWKAANGEESRSISFNAVAEKNGFNKEESSDIYNYFLSEGFFLTFYLGKRHKFVALCNSRN